MPANLEKNVGNKKIRKPRKHKSPKGTLRNKTRNNAVNNNSDLFQVVENKSKMENILKDYVVKENEQESGKPVSQKKLAKMEKVNSRKDKSLPTKSLATEERTIFVGNVNIKSTRGEVTKYFAKFGEIETVRFRGIIPESEGISKKEAAAKKLLHHHRKSLNAYVRFKDKASVDKALEANGEIFNEFHIHVDRATPSSNQKDKHSVFVGNLPWEANEEELWQLFGNCGKVTDVRIVRSASTGAGKGFGFVSFESDDGVQLALHFNGKKVMNRELRVKKPVKKVKDKQQLETSKKYSKRKASVNLTSKGKRMSKPMDVSFLKNDKPQIFSKKSEGKGKKRKRNDKNVEGLSTPKDFKGVKAVNEGKVIKKKKKRLNQAEKRKLILAKKLASTL